MWISVAGTEMTISYYYRTLKLSNCQFHSLHWLAFFHQHIHRQLISLKNAFSMKSIVVCSICRLRATLTKNIAVRLRLLFWFHSITNRICFLPLRSLCSFDDWLSRSASCSKEYSRKNTLRRSGNHWDFDHFFVTFVGFQSLSNLALGPLGSLPLAAVLLV